jgi:hypothetical protein
MKPPPDAFREYFVCPTCKDFRHLEVYRQPSNETGYVCYCRKCEEGCVTPEVVKEPLP